MMTSGFRIDQFQVRLRLVDSRKTKNSLNCIFDRECSRINKVNNLSVLGIKTSNWRPRIGIEIWPPFPLQTTGILKFRKTKIVRPRLNLRK